jgi:hypothetical protein
MLNDTLTINGDALRESLHAWQSEQESLEAEWNESLAALAAYQSHLDGWQRELVEEREALRAERDAFERARVAAATEQEQASSQTIAALAEARATVALQNEQLVARAEELRTLEKIRSDLAAELDASRGIAKQLAADAADQKRAIEIERKVWTDQLAQFRDLLEQRATAPVTGYDDVAMQRAAEAATPAPPRPAKAPGGERPSANNPVLGSIVEQFGKLRQQRASDRQAGRNTR